MMSYGRIFAYLHASRMRQYFAVFLFIYFWKLYVSQGKLSQGDSMSRKNNANLNSISIIYYANSNRVTNGCILCTIYQRTWGKKYPSNFPLLWIVPCLICLLLKIIGSNNHHCHCVPLFVAAAVSASTAVPVVVVVVFSATSKCIFGRVWCIFMFSYESVLHNKCLCTDCTRDTERKERYKEHSTAQNWNVLFYAAQQQKQRTGL